MGRGQVLVRKQTFRQGGVYPVIAELPNTSHAVAVFRTCATSRRRLPEAVHGNPDWQAGHRQQSNEFGTVWRKPSLVNKMGAMNGL